MKWLIPSKTFLLGEYSAVLGGAAIVLTTRPCFELSLLSGENQTNIHPDSPAGRWWKSCEHGNYSLGWFDPYGGIGGLGASSAQFLGAYLANAHLNSVTPNYKDLVAAYEDYSWQGEGLRPSGYDLLAQSQNHCVFLCRQQEMIQSYEWVFADIGFLLLHSGQKLATHTHLAGMTSPPKSWSCLSRIAESAQMAFEERCTPSLLTAINDYQTQLTKLGLVAPLSLQMLQTLSLKKEVLAAKGCGAMGADVLLVVTKAASLKSLRDNLTDEGWAILASSLELYSDSSLISLPH